EGVICINELTMGLMAQNLVTPGFSSLVVLLTTSVTDKVAEELVKNARENNGNAGIYLRLFVSRKITQVFINLFGLELDWTIEYISGLQQEIYEVRFPVAFAGKTFLKCSELIYTHFNAVLFSIGVRRTLANGTASFQIILNPQDYVLKGDEIGFVISDNAEISDRMDRFNRETSGPQGLIKRIESFFDLNGNDSDRKIIDSRIESNGRSQTSYFTQADMPECTERTRILPATLTPGSEVSLANVKKAKACLDKPLDSVIQNIKNHVLVCNCANTFPLNLDVFVAVLREKNSACRDMPVVILTNCSPPDYEKNLLVKFGNVHFVQGSPLRRKDLYRAGADRAKRCAVLCDATRCEESRDTADAASLMVALNIESLLTKDCFVLVECMYRETFKMICE
ncbi:16018_t:CDS:2, partial [Acaulospora colombiana]